MRFSKVLKSGVIAAAAAAMLLASAPSAFAAGYKYDTDGEWKLSSVVKSSGYDITPSQRYAYKKLTANEKKLYKRLVNGITDLEKEIEYPKGTTIESITRVYHTVFLEEPQLFWIEDSFDYDAVSVYPSYKTESKAEITKMQNSVNKNVKAILAKASEKKDDFSKINYFHDYIITKNYHSDSTMDKDVHFSLYEAFVGHYPLTEEKYAAAMQYLCDLSGIECLTVYSTYTSDWNKGDPAYINVVKSNGNWYNINVAADDDMGNDHGDKNYISRFHMMVPDKWIYNSEYGGEHGKKNVIKLTAKKNCTLFTPPACTKTTDNYFTRNKLVFSTKESAKAAAIKQLEAGMKKKSRKVYCQFRCSDPEVSKYMASEDAVNEVYYAAAEKYTIKDCGYVVYGGGSNGIVMYSFYLKY